MSGHTPGPWTVDQTMRMQILGSLSEPVALILYPERTVASVNARLIAAAPDLLVASQGSLLLFSELLEVFKRAGFRPIANADYVSGVLRAAIAKAEGK